jgi:hypothetical protein
MSSPDPMDNTPKTVKGPTPGMSYVILRTEERVMLMKGGHEPHRDQNR